MPPFQVKVIGAVAEDSHVLRDDIDSLPLYSQTVNEYAVNLYLHWHFSDLMVIYLEILQFVCAAINFSVK